MNLETIKDFLLGGGGIIVIILTIIQISPIKINPWSYLANKIGRAFNRELINKVDKLNDKVIKLETKSDERSANSGRAQILRFGDEVRHGVPHSKEHYDNILMIIHKYQVYCGSHPHYINNVAVATIKYIEASYQKHLENDDFL